MIEFGYCIPTSPTKYRFRTFQSESAMRAYLKTLWICYGKKAIDYGWCWTTEEAQRSNGFNG